MRSRPVGSLHQERFLQSILVSFGNPPTAMWKTTDNALSEELQSFACSFLRFAPHQSTHSINAYQAITIAFLEVSESACLSKERTSSNRLPYGRLPVTKCLRSSFSSKPSSRTSPIAWCGRFSFTPHSWIGNVCELRNAIQRARFLCQGFHVSD